MTKHYNPSIVERANRILASKSGDFLSDEVNPNIVMNIPVTPVQKLFLFGDASTSGATGTLQTTPSDKDTYITNVEAAIIKDATCDAADSTFRINAVVDGVTRVLAAIPTITLTAQNSSIAMHFNPPIKIDRDTAITTTQGTFTAGKYRRVSIVTGYTEEVTR